MLCRRVACVLSLAAALAGPGRTAAQQETATFTGRLVNRETRAPIEGATVVLLGTAGTATSDSAGGFRYAGLSPGDHRLEARAIGYAKGVWLVSLAAGEQSHEFELDVLRYELYHTGTRTTLTLLSPVGADNVDPWRIVTESLRTR